MGRPYKELQLQEKIEILAKVRKGIDRDSIMARHQIGPGVLRTALKSLGGVNGYKYKTPSGLTAGS